MGNGCRRPRSIWKDCQVDQNCTSRGTRWVSLLEGWTMNDLTIYYCINYITHFNTLVSRLLFSSPRYGDCKTPWMSSKFHRRFAPVQSWTLDMLTACLRMFGNASWAMKSLTPSQPDLRALLSGCFKGSSLAMRTPRNYSSSPEALDEVS